MGFSVITDVPGIKQALFQITHGLYILTAAHEGRLNGQCLDALMQVTSEPLKRKSQNEKGKTIIQNLKLAF